MQIDGRELPTLPGTLLHIGEAITGDLLNGYLKAWEIKQSDQPQTARPRPGCRAFNDT